MWSKFNFATLILQKDMSVFDAGWPRTATPENVTQKQAMWDWQDHNVR